MNELMIIKGVRARLREDGVAELNLEDTARGLGFTQIAKSGNQVVRWETMRRYLENYGIPTCWDGEKPPTGREGLPEMIPENIFYKLCLKAENKTAVAFQDMVTDTILPTIRRTGGYIANSEMFYKSSLEEMKAKAAADRAQAMLVNARVRAYNAIMKDARESGASPVAIEVFGLTAIETITGHPVNYRPRADQKLFDATAIAKHLGVLSAKGKPHAQAVSAIIKKLNIPKEHITSTIFNKNGHQGTTVQFAEPVIDQVTQWLEENDWPSAIVHEDDKGRPVTYRVVYKRAA